jgi:hypothetical protein
VFWLCAAGAAGMLWLAYYNANGRSEDRAIALALAGALLVVGLIVYYVFSAGKSSDPNAKPLPERFGPFISGAFSILLFIAAGAVGKEFGGAAYTLVMTAWQRSLSPPPNTPQEAFLPVETMEMRLRSELPKKVDALTTLVAVGHSGDVFVYNYQIDAERSKIDPASFKPAVKAALCHSDALRSVFRYGFMVRNIYVDRKSESIGVVDVKEGDCSRS